MHIRHKYISNKDNKRKTLQIGLIKPMANKKKLSMINQKVRLSSFINNLDLNNLQNKK